MKPKVFITGIRSGLLSAWWPLMRDAPFEFIGLSRRTEPALEGIRIIQGDLLEDGPWRAACTSADIVIHGAAITHSRDTLDYERVNHHATVDLVNSCKDDVRFIFISSRAAHLEGGAYSKSKWLAEQYVKSTISNRLILRPSEVYGTDKGEGIDRIIHDVRSKSIVIHPTGKHATVAPIHLSDCIARMDSLSFRHENGIRVINGPEELSFPELISRLELIFHRKVLRIGIPEWMMRLLGGMGRILPGLLPFNPDQVARLYCQKEFEPSPRTPSIEDRLA